ncbi:MAG TPA: pyridoxal phosphate-dependent aminotransferase [Terriglobales bacterium]|nr:pyridoxal phosphate-dependent aminotransferase [Terriglobales bacterium]
MPSLSARAGRIAQSEIRVMSVECEKVCGVNLAQGVCDTPVPIEVRQAAEQAIELGHNSYTRLDGVHPLRQQIARKMLDFNGVGCDPEKEVVVTAGSTGAFYCACLALLNPGDEVILFEPYYGYHLHTVLSVDAVPVYVTLKAPDWKFWPEDVEKAITPRTRAIVVNSPANPSGRVFSRTELETIAELAKKHDLFVITDEIYEYFLYDDLQHLSMATLPGMRDRTITISGYSKTFSITGWRIGYAVADARWAHAIGYYSDLCYVCAPAPLQHGVAAGIALLKDDFYRELRTEYAKKRDLICSTLDEVGLTPSVPSGAYYVLSDASKLPGNSSKAKSMYLLEKTGVATVPGGAFYHDDAGENLIRFCFAKTQSDLENACERLRKL